MDHWMPDSSLKEQYLLKFRYFTKKNVIHVVQYISYFKDLSNTFRNVLVHN